jgi:hypothetical protein
VRELKRGTDPKIKGNLNNTLYTMNTASAENCRRDLSDSGSENIGGKKKVRR